MMRFGGVFWFVLVIASGMTNFLVKQTVQNLDEQLVHMKRQTADEQRKIHDLTADWTYLNQPGLLTNLNVAYIHLQQVSPKQVIGSIDDIPLRPAPPAPPPEAAPPLAQAMPPAAPMPAAAPPPARTPIVPVSVSAQAATQAIPAARPTLVAAAMTVPVRPQPLPAAPQGAPPSSLDALFAQVAGGR